MDKKLLIRRIFLAIVSLAGMGVALFWPAGRINWWPAWGALAVSAAWLAAMEYVILRIHPGLLAERQGATRDTKRWDAILSSIIRLITLARYIVAGLDQRNGWTGGLPAAAQISALILCALGYALFIRAMAANPFFSEVVRIQSERGHTAVQTGPYRTVRHPAYAGTILYELAVAFLLGSWPALILSGVNIFLFILRTALEDRTLLSELPGYQEYARQVRYRLVPGIW